MSEITIVEEHNINVHMFLIPKTKKVHFTNFEDSDEESSETYKKMTKLIETKEIDIPFTISIAKIKRKSDLYMGIEFQNGKVVYRKVKMLKYKDTTIYSDSPNLAFIPADGALTLCSMERCFTCHGMFKKIYRCFDCFPHSDPETSEDIKKRNKYDFCKACYKRRDHTNHRIIALTLNDDIVDKYPILDE